MTFFVQVNNWWSQIKTAGSAIYANRHFLNLYKRMHLERLANRGTKDNTDDGSLICNIIGDVYIHPTASIDPTATVTANLLNIFLVFNRFIAYSSVRTYQLDQEFPSDPVSVCVNLSYSTMPSSRIILWFYIA